MKQRHRRKKTIQKFLIYATHLGAILPILIYTVLFFNGNLGIDPVRESILKTGKTALILLLITLAITPMITFAKLSILQPLRRLFGLYTFGYAGVHLLLFLGLDYGFNPGMIWEALFEKRYAVIGLTAFLLMIPLVITSSNKWIKRLGKNWKRLHKLVYLVGVLVIVHFIWLTKQGVLEPWYFGLVLAALLILRVPPVKHLLQTIRRKSFQRNRDINIDPKPEVRAQTETQ
ncbi:MAG: sulfoxide reductase heme-binding subunit YedZ [Aliifodinibius sp.]|nr:sulfoxide reductase heme-binding subunit YedZ [candidate division Zixibacteria bacterium]NIT57079.1 sulfoxide reductase heme-binding subunit YedZ [Fodinibius sp.]NIW44934.1 sulfoxide reductase heme-binding subunit YedZ [Gammaproteobacteria bacterium]NIR64102.1 sulfoxide reductase heme-binding subunit YedZ [candidate division Zixibacteria bacterium]NIS46000.1 sulfoxide reductase heme-binding subunit YedZ [candidate division Zixibacteria bacterium]